MINVGDKVPADIRILKLKTTSVRTDEGALTGESETVMKQLEPVAKEARIQDKKNMLFSGTTVSNGAAVGLVVATGMSTEMRQAYRDEMMSATRADFAEFGALLASAELKVAVFGSEEAIEKANGERPADAQMTVEKLG